MKNVFVSRPTVIGTRYETAYKRFDEHLNKLGIRPRRLGKTDYTRESPLKAVIGLIDKCSAAIIMGYPQMIISQSVLRGTKLDNNGISFSTPWNHIEGALAYSAKIPVLVVADDGVGGGIFDHGVTGEMVLSADLKRINWHEDPSFAQPFEQWRSEFIRKRRVPAGGTRQRP